MIPPRTRSPPSSSNDLPSLPERDRERERERERERSSPIGWTENAPGIRLVTEIPAMPRPDNPYLQLTAAFNAGRLREIVCSGQAVVLHRLTMMSKDGDWIVREDEADLAHIRQVLTGHGARYHFGAPLDARWLAGGWSAHFEFRTQTDLRLRTDFFSRPPRLDCSDELARLWVEQRAMPVPFVGAPPELGGHENDAAGKGLSDYRRAGPRA